MAERGERRGRVGAALLWLAGALGASAATAVETGASETATLVLRGATLIDLSDFGRGDADLERATVVLRGERIVAVGPEEEIPIPADARVVEAHGQFLVPGLIDAFAVQNSESQARAWLHSGVTTVFFNAHDPRRGQTLWVPGGPRLVAIGLAAGFDQSQARDWDTPGELRARAPALDAGQLTGYLAARHWDGFEALLLYYPLSIEQTRVLAAGMRARGMIGIGEIGHAGTLASARAGVPLLVHANRYLIDLAPADVRQAVADDPFGPARTRYMDFLRTLDPEGAALRDFGRALARERSALVPTFALFAQALPDAPNPWRDPVAAILDPAEIMLPADRETGALPPPGALWERMRGDALTLLALHRSLARSGVRFVVGSGATAFGALPGLATHTEMELLVRIGLSPRQALAAATANLSALVPSVDYGVIRPGAHADLLLLDADPRTDIRHVRRIARLFVAGEERDRAALLHTPLEVPL